MDMDMQYGFGYAAWTWTVHPCMDARMPECLNADEKLSSASLVFR
jgi:hypothetical protein